MQAINTLAIPVLSYGFGIIDWMQEDLNKLDVMTRKMLHAHKMTYKNQCVPRIHVSRKKGGMGVPTIDIIYKSEIIGIGKYLKGNDGRFIGWVHEHENLKPSTCLLYTSDAADERSSVDLGGRRIIKKKKK